jgi:hypothetical protein
MGHFHNFFLPSVKLMEKEKKGLLPSKSTIPLKHLIKESWNQSMSIMMLSSP